MKTVILGASGLLGSELVSSLRAGGFDVRSPSRTELDLADAASIDAYISSQAPDCVINAGGVIDVDRYESDPLPAWQINALGPGAIARALSRAAPQAIFIHLSSSYVFAGRREAYTEGDALSPTTVYGRTKALSEELVAHYAASARVRYFIIRTSWLYGKSRDTFVDAVARDLLSGRTVRASTAQFGNPTSVADLSRTLVSEFARGGRPSGIYHLVNAAPPEGVSRLALAACIGEVLRVPGHLIEGVSDPEAYAVQRPSVVLLNTAGPTLPPWDESLRAYVLARHAESRPL